MKKLIALALTLLMALSLCSCKWNKLPEATEEAKKAAKAAEAAAYLQQQVLSMENDR